MNATQVIQEVFKDAMVENSSDLIVTLYQTYKKLGFTEKMLKIDPIYQWEYSNWHSGWESNCAFIHRKLELLDDSDYEEVLDSYEFILNEFLSTTPFNYMYKMDDKDIIGWNIFKELSEKRESVKKQRIIAEYHYRNNLHVKI